MEKRRSEKLSKQVWMAEWVFKLIFSGDIQKPLTVINFVELQSIPEEKNLLNFISNELKEIHSMGIDVDDVNELVIEPKSKTPIWVNLFGADLSLSKDPDNAMAIITININSKGYAFSVETELEDAWMN